MKRGDRGFNGFSSFSRALSLPLSLSLSLSIVHSHITGPGSNIAPRSATAITATAPLLPPATRLVPSKGSTATSTARACGAVASPTRSPQKSMGALSFSPVFFWGGGEREGRVFRRRRMGAAAEVRERERHGKTLCLFPPLCFLSSLFSLLPLSPFFYPDQLKSLSPSPITITPSIGIVFSTRRMMSTAAPSAASLSPRPRWRAPARAAASVTRTSSRARERFEEEVQE